MDALVGARGTQHERIAEHRADELQADRQTVRGQAARHGACRLLGQIEGITERCPPEQAPSGVIAPCARRPRIEGRDRNGRCDQQIEALHELAHMRAQRSAPQIELLHLERAEAGAETGLGGEIRIGETSAALT